MDATRRRTLTLPPGGIPSFASLFAILQLVILLNAFSVSFLLRRYHRGDGPRSLAHLQDWNLSTLCPDVGMSEAGIAFSVPLAWQAKLTQEEDACHRHLRFCPVCLTGDFHTAAFQLLMFKCCPVHGEALVDACPHCGKMRPYSLAALQRQSFVCDCQEVSWNLINTTEERRRWMGSMNAYLTDFLSWLIGVRTFVAVSAVSPAEGPPRAIVYSSGSAVERLATISGALAITLTKPTLIDSYPPTSSFQTEYKPGRESDAVEVRGRGAGGRELSKRLDTPHDAPLEVDSSPFNKFFSKSGVETVRSLRPESSRLRLNSLAHIAEFVDPAIKQLLLFVRRKHEPCVVLNESLPSTMRTRFHTDICPVLTATRELQSRWATRQQLEFHVRYCDLIGSIRPSPKGALPRALVEFLAAELTCLKFVSEVKRICATLMGPNCVEELNRLIHSADDWAATAFAITYPTTKGAPQIASCGMVDHRNWQRSWANACLFSDPHFEEVEGEHRTRKAHYASLGLMVEVLRGRR